MPRIRSVVLAASVAVTACGATPAERDSSTLLFSMIVTAPVWIPAAAVAMAIKSVQLSLADGEPKPEVEQTGPGANRP